MLCSVAPIYRKCWANWRGFAKLPNMKIKAGVITMKLNIHLILSCVIGFSLAGCEQHPSAGSPALEKTVASVEIPKYSAQAFFETTSYGLVGSTGHACSADA